jgi:DNA repair protein RadD
MSFELRPYQADAIATTYARCADGHRPIVCAATGSGKTVIAAHIARDFVEQGKRVLWMTGREEIIRQAYATFSSIIGLRKIGVCCAALQHETPWWSYPDVAMASWDTLKARWNKSDIWKIPADVILVDEAHLSLSPIMAETIMPHYQSKTVIGFTATPARRTGRGLGSYYTRIIQVRSVQQLIDDGFLAPCEYWAGAHVDVSRIGVDKKTNDYREKELARASMEGKLIGDVIDNWLRVAKDRHTIVFAVDIAHAQALAERFQDAGIDAAVIHSKMTHGTRSEISEQFKAGKIQILVNVGIATYGYDVPSINCTVLARPTKSIVLHHQMIGRGIRPKGGDYNLVLDHADNVRRLGCIEDEIRWRLSDGKDAATNTTREGDPTRNKQGEAPPIECTECHHLFSRSRVCPKCGWEKPAAAVDIQTVEADLVKIRKAKADQKLEQQDRRTWYLMAREWCIQRGKKPGMAFYRYCDKFGEKPPTAWNGMNTVEPDVRVDAYMRSGLIRFAKSKRRQAEAAA